MTNDATIPLTKSSPRHQIIVAGVLERAGRYVLIEELVDGHPVLNQPAGRLEPGETAPAGAVRETCEESGFLFEPEALVGIYQWRHSAIDTIYLRLAYTGSIVSTGKTLPSDPHILAVHWLTIKEMTDMRHRLRSPFVLQCACDHASGKRLPLNMVQFFPDND